MLERTDTGRRLLRLLVELHSDFKVILSVGWQRSLTDPVFLKRDVQENCLLAPCLFNIYVNRIIQAKDSQNFFSSLLKKFKVPVWLYADNMALVSYSEIRLRRTMVRLADYNEKKLRINYNKTKIVVFSCSGTKHGWRIHVLQTEQCPLLKCIAAAFQEFLPWKTYISPFLIPVCWTLGVNLLFLVSKRGQFIAPALKILRGKVVIQLLCDTEMKRLKEKMLTQLEIIQDSCLKKILDLLQSTFARLLKIEAGLPLLTVNIHLILLKYFKKSSDKLERELYLLTWLDISLNYGFGISIGIWITFISVVTITRYLGVYIYVGFIYLYSFSY
ncbi:pro-neuregulin-4, membrane-bound isoform isoform X1 [Sceloporus undulatus]|uniref:pro-neuregulin-4, membrane-bound isoform isoform X1 n=1 Tax=Sceloporus undulatus TaxID=8520 RepID=UPI001C4AEC75|nr:pro-neuregulin-4, membrane-bound isoform isoform X1 [Sceloporus undulatus]